MSSFMLDRRQLLAGLSASAALLSAERAAALSEFTVGRAKVMALSDGALAVPPAMFSNTTEADKVLLGGGIELAANTYAYQNGGRTFLFDAGSGKDHYISQQFPTVGKLAGDLAAAGIDPTTVTDIVVTHMHIDHIGGLVPEGRPVFANATIHVSETDWNIWNNPDFAAAAPDQLKPMVNAVQQVGGIVGENIKTHSGEADLGAGVAMVPTPGHTPGHCGILLTSGSEQLLLIGDAIVTEKVHFANPDAGWALEADQALAAKTRRAILDQAATDKIMIAGSHISRPGTGFVERDGDAYRFVPA
ncbi:MBL fold metallo-hydrolase [Paracoccus homiensis]|uniref:MBL fold metallo-hydrolase n=1 Tax=Paracoccus homiensis TaxID=364199 RepID=UPI00398D5E1D